NDDRIAVSLDVRQPFVQDAPAKRLVFNVGASDARLNVFPHGVMRTDGITVACVGIREDRDLRRAVLDRVMWSSPTTSRARAKRRARWEFRGSVPLCRWAPSAGPARAARTVRLHTRRLRMPEHQRMTTRLKTLFQRPELFVLAGGINPVGAKMAEALGYD